MGVVDYLDEDTEVRGQKYFVLSYILPSSSSEQPMIKMRGAFPDIEGCKKRIEKLKAADSYFNLFICESFKWGGLFTPEQIAKDNDLEVSYRNEKMNEMMKKYKENKDEKDVQFDERKRKLMNNEVSEEELAERKDNIDFQIDELTKQLEFLREQKNK